MVDLCCGERGGGYRACDVCRGGGAECGRDVCRGGGGGKSTVESVGQATESPSNTAGWYIFMCLARWSFL